VVVGWRGAVRLRMLILLLASAADLAACTSTRRASSIDFAAPSGSTLARIYYWRARPGKLEEYNRYIHEIAEPIDREAQRRGAFLSVTTYVTRDTLSPWSHMRIFLLRDSTQLVALSAALDSAGARLEPDASRRRARSEYAATLRDRFGDATVELLR
jgi:hypothetical protein